MSIRVATPADRAAIERVAVSSGLFAEGETDWVASMLGEPTHHWWVAEEGEQLLGAVLVAPEAYGDRVWNVLFIAVDPTAQQGGIGRALMGQVESVLGALGEDGARVLMVETSSAPSQNAARTFYLVLGFERHAQIHEYYGPGEHKVVFWKPLVDMPGRVRRGRGSP